MKTNQQDTKTKTPLFARQMKGKPLSVKTRIRAGAREKHYKN